MKHLQLASHLIVKYAFPLPSGTRHTEEYPRQFSTKKKYKTSKLQLKNKTGFIHK